MGGSSKTPSIATPAAPEAPTPYQQEQSISEHSQQARDNQLKKAQAALGQQGSVLTSPFGSQEQTSKQKKTLLGE